MSGIDAGPAWTAWTQVTPVVAAPRGNAPYVRVPLPLAVAPNNDGSYPDLRVVDANGRERPYALDPDRPRSAERSVALIDVGFVPNRGTQAVIDLGPSGVLVGSVTLGVDSAARPTYFEHVAVDTSDDRRSWRIVRDDAVVYRVAQSDSRADTTLTFPPTRSRWIRVRVLDPGAAFPLIGAHVVSEPPPPLELVPVEPVERDDPIDHSQRWIFAPPAPLRATAVVFADGGAQYQRSVTVETSDDDAIWAWQGEGTIARFAAGSSQTLIPVNEQTARFVRVTVHNNDDAPVPALQPALLVRAHSVVFPSGGAPRLLSGNPNIGAPSYDLGAQLAHQNWTAENADDAETVPNAGYRDPRPFLERVPWFLTAALLAAAAALGAIALRTLRGPG